MPLNGNLVERTTGVDVWQLYDLANVKERNVVLFELVWVTDPLEPTRQCLKRGTSSYMKCMFGMGYVPDIHEPNESTPQQLYKPVLNTALNLTNQLYWTNLIGKTIEFSYYPNQINQSYKLILNNMDKYAAGPPSGSYGIDFVQYQNSFRCFTWSTNGNNIERTIATGIQANKWYRFKIEHIDLGNETFDYRITIFDGDNAIGYIDEQTLGHFYYGSRNANNRRTLFFNTHYNYYYGYNNVANTQAYLKDLLMYENA